MIDHVGLNVRNLEESISFYETFLGLGLIEKWENPRQAFVGKGDIVLGLIEKPDYDFGVYTMAHIAFPCAKKDFSKVVEKVRQYGLDVVSGPKPQRGGETILFRDPSGNILEVCYPSIKKATGEMSYAVGIYLDKIRE